MLKPFVLLCLLAACSDNLNYGYTSFNNSDTTPPNSGEMPPTNRPDSDDLDNQLTSSYVESIETNSVDGYYSTGDEISFFVSFSSEITVSGGSPKLVFSNPDKGRILDDASFVRQSSADTLEFSYKIQLDDNAELIDFLSIDFNGSKITDASYYMSRFLVSCLSPKGFW